MENLKRSNHVQAAGSYRAKAIFLLLLVATLLPGIASAHGNEKHVMGKVTAVAADSISVEGASNKVQVVYVTDQTKFLKSGDASTLHDLKAGDRVVIHAKPVGDRL